VTIVLAMLAGALIATLGPWITATLYLNPWLAVLLLAALVILALCSKGART
jgi:hypothetical protein